MYGIRVLCASVLLCVLGSARWETFTANQATSTKYLLLQDIVGLLSWGLGVTHTVKLTRRLHWMCAAVMGTVNAVGVVQLTVYAADVYVMYGGFDCAHTCVQLPSVKYSWKIHHT